MPVFSFNDSTFATFPLKGFTLRHYGEMLANTSMMAALQEQPYGRPFCVSIVATAIGLARGHGADPLPPAAAAAPCLSAMMLPLVIPSIVMAVALLVIILRFLHSSFRLWTDRRRPHRSSACPSAMTVLMSRLEGFDKSLEEASRDLGKTPG